MEPKFLFIIGQNFEIKVWALGAILSPREALLWGFLQKKDLEERYVCMIAPTLTVLCHYFWVCLSLRLSMDDASTVQPTGAVRA